VAASISARRPVLEVFFKQAFSLFRYERFPSFLSSSWDTSDIVSEMCRPSQTPQLEISAIRITAISRLSLESATFVAAPHNRISEATT